MREESVKGYFYPSEKVELKRLVINLLKSSIVKTKNKVKGIIVPHAGYEFSGKTAAYAYNALKNNKFDSLVIIGTDHSASGVYLSKEDFKTPLGIIKNDKKFSSELNNAGIEANERIHSFEHSIEVQLPFLKTIFKDIKIVPILAYFSDYAQCEEIADKIIKVSKKLKRKIGIIASGDFTHYGMNYGYMPFLPNNNTKNRIYLIDKKAIDAISKLKSKEFFDYAKNSSICGFSSIALSLNVLKKLKAKKAELLNYSNSGDFSKDYNNCVSYASFAIY